MSEWTKDRPTEPGYWWAWERGYAFDTVNPYLAEVVRVPGPVTDGCNFELRRFGRTGWLLQSSEWDGLWWLRADIRAPTPPPASMPAWERAVLKFFKAPPWTVGKNALRDAVIAAIREEEARDE